ncbi:MAG: hypothetical protein HOH66_11325 [Rhodospirillaceae bacterium]|jgi:cellulose synthase operon protein C|nr:hypothetical protein [Rhodospirillaceae bacterium]MBT6118445.1 hypothetical protein [Rhodospirillaceae bacterium]
MARAAEIRRGGMRAASEALSRTWRKRVVGRAYYLAAMSVVAVGLATAYLLLPRDRELGLMYLEDKEFAEARQTYEERLGIGDLGVPVVLPLIEIYLHYGEVDKAVALMERFLAARPMNVDAREHLGEFLKDAQRYGDYRRNLEILAELAPSAAILRALAGVYVIEGEDEARMRILGRLVANFDATAAEYERLAELQAAYGYLAAAAETLDRLRRRSPAALDGRNVLFLASLLMDLERTADAFTLASERLRQSGDGQEGLDLAELFGRRGVPDMGLRLLDLAHEDASELPGFLAALVGLEAEAGRQQQAFDRLLPLYEAGTLPPDLDVAFIDLAMQLGRMDLAFAAVDKVAIDGLPGWLLLGLTENALAQGRASLANDLVARLGEDFLDGHPILAARLAFLRGDKDGGDRWLKEAEGDNALSVDQRLALAGLYRSLGRDGAAIDALKGIAGMESPPEEVMAALAELYLETGRAEEGLAFMNALRAHRASPATDAAWAVLSATVEGEAAALAWLEGLDPAALSDQLLTDLYFIALDNAKGGLAVAAAERLYTRSADAVRALYLARALSLTGGGERALALLRPMLPGDGETRAAYVEALVAALKAGAPVREELVAYLEERLADPDTTPVERESLVGGLLDAGAYAAALPVLEQLADDLGGDWIFAFIDAANRAGEKKRLAAFLERALNEPGIKREQREALLYQLQESAGPAAALPYLRDFAERYGGPWVFAYADTLEQLGRLDEAVDALARAALGPGLNEEERRAIGFRILEAGRIARATEVFEVLAAREPANGPAVQQLLYLWGPRPVPEQLDWLALRAEGAPDAEQRALWLDHLIGGGGAQRALDLAANDPGPPDGPVFGSYLNALAALRLRTPLAEGLNLRILVEDRVDALRHLGQIAGFNQLPAQSRAAYEKLLVQRPDDREALREAGLAASAEGDYRIAARHLDRYLELGEGDAELHFLYAEILGALRWMDMAAYHYRIAVEQVARLPAPGYGPRLIEANALARLGEGARAEVAFNTLRGERPDDAQLRADLASLLIDTRDYDGAERVLGQE